MGRPGGITSIPYGEFKERVPRLDQQLRIVLRCAKLVYEDGIDNLADLIRPTGKPETENWMEFVGRRANERQATLETRVESYVLDKGFGTETARAIIRHRQEYPDPVQAEDQPFTW